MPGHTDRWDMMTDEVQDGTPSPGDIAYEPLATPTILPETLAGLQQQLAAAQAEAAHWRESNRHLVATQAESTRHLANKRKRSIVGFAIMSCSLVGFLVFAGLWTADMYATSEDERHFESHMRLVNVCQPVSKDMAISVLRTTSLYLDANKDDLDGDQAKDAEAAIDRWIETIARGENVTATKLFVTRKRQPRHAFVLVAAFFVMSLIWSVMFVDTST